MTADLNEATLTTKLTQLEKARRWSPGVIDKLGKLVRTAEPFALYRLNPIQFGLDHQVNEVEAVDLFLHATRAGLLRLEWRLLCPGCSDTLESLSSLSQLDSQCFCSLCNRDVEGQLDDLIHVSFTVASEVRRLPTHDPERLAVDDYLYKFRFSMEALTPSGAPEMTMLKQLIVDARWLAAGEEAKVSVNAAGPWLVLHDAVSGADARIPTDGDPGLARQLDLRLTETGFEGVPAKIAAGALSITVRNATARKAAFLSLVVPQGNAAPPLHFEHPFTGNSLLSSQTFRDLYRSDVIKGSEGIGVRDVTLLFTDLKGSTEMYERIGDIRAFTLVQGHFECLTRAIQRCGGAVVKTIGDAVMACFARPTDAVRASLELLAEIEAYNREEGERQIVLKVGIHRGPSIAVTLNDRLDYFGQTVNIAARVQGIAEANEICVTRDVIDFPGVKQILGERTVVPEQANLKGIARPMSICRIGGAAA
jgi:class 3 adenylate cyclase